MSHAVIVLGFHRSGTSMTTRLLHRLGVGLGPEEEMLAADPDDNARGYWEPEWMIELNEDVLVAMGGSHLEPPDMPAGWERDPRLDRLRARAAGLLDRTFAGAPLWGWKDPRTCLTFPFWRALVAERAERVSFVVCVRSPAESVTSMMARPYYPWMGAAEFGDLWLEYTGRALLETAAAPRVVVFYEDLLADPVGELARIAALLGVALPDAELLRADVEDGLRHHVRTALDTAVAGALRAARDALRFPGATPELAEALELVAVEHALAAVAARAPREPEAPDEHALVADRLAMGMWEGPPA
jgi:O-antigen biosynthesis protein